MENGEWKMRMEMESWNKTMEMETWNQSMEMEPHEIMENGNGMELMDTGCKWSIPQVKEIWIIFLGINSQSTSFLKGVIGTNWNLFGKTELWV